MITPTAMYGGAGSTSSLARTTTLGRDQFLQLLVTQLKNQDPTSPLQPHEFAAQLAQFSSVEQLTQLNDGLASLEAAQQTMSALGQASFSASLVGKDVLAEGNHLTIASGTAPGITVDVSGTGGRATLVLRDADGHETVRRDLGTVAGGRQTIALPGDLPPGEWTYALEVKDAAGKIVKVQTYVRGRVDRVSFNDGAIQLRIGGFDVGLDQLVEVAGAA